MFQSIPTPPHKSLEISSIARELLVFDNLYRGALPRYETNPETEVHALAGNAIVVSTGDEILLPLMEFGSNRTVSNMATRRDEFALEAAKADSRKSVSLNIDRNLIHLINAAAPRENDINQSEKEASMEGIRGAMTALEFHNNTASHILMHPSHHIALKPDPYEKCDSPFGPEIRVIYSPYVPRNCFYVVGANAPLGVLAFKEPITTIVEDDPKRMARTVHSYQTAAMGVLHPEAIARVLVKPSEGAQDKIKTYFSRPELRLYKILENLVLLRGVEKQVVLPMAPWHRYDLHYPSLRTVIDVTPRFGEELGEVERSDKALQAQGYRVIRFSELDVQCHKQYVRDTIRGIQNIY